MKYKGEVIPAIYKVGDVVTITNKHIDKHHSTPAGLWMHSDMRAMDGQKHVITMATTGPSNRTYRLKDCKWVWDAWCFEETDKAMDFTGVEELI